MTDKELKKLKDDLWHSADVLRVFFVQVRI